MLMAPGAYAAWGFHPSSTLKKRRLKPGLLWLPVARWGQWQKWPSSCIAVCAAVPEAGWGWQLTLGLHPARASPSSS